MTAWYSIRAAAGATRVAIHNSIGHDGVNAERFLEEISKIDGPIALSVCSVGGDFFGGMLIADTLRRRGEVTAYVNLAASIASAIALSADRVVISEDGFFMTHSPYVTITGNADDLERMADTLRKLRGTLTDLYRRETGQPEATVKRWLDGETWFDSKESVRVGLADAVDGQSSMKASIDLSRFKNPPAALRALAAPDGWDRVISTKFQRVAG